jgi:hypothetical protein
VIESRHRHTRALLAAVLTGGGLVLLGGTEPHERVIAGSGVLLLAAALVGVELFAGIRMWRIRRRRSAPPEE